MSNFLKIGNSQQNFETEKALGKATDFDVNAGEVVEVSWPSPPSTNVATGSHRIAQPVGAVVIGKQMTTPADINWEVGSNSITATALANCSGTMKFLVF